MSRAARTLLALFLVLTWGFYLGESDKGWAQSLSEVKKAGWVGERPDGYLGFVKPNAPGSVKQFVQSINTKRRTRYQEIAKKNGTSLKSVQAIIGPKLIKRAKPGEFIMDATGKWIKK
jgi:uncharacterized protein YdbL (DUF1318 family)